MKRGNIIGLATDIKKVASRLRHSRDTFTQFRKRYGVCPYTLKRELLAVMSESEYLSIAKAKLAQGNEPQRWTSAWGIRGAAARKWKAIGTISVKTRHRKYGPGPRKKTRITKVPWIKVQDHGAREQRWMRLAVYNWTKANGPVPQGFYVVSKNGDTMNCSPENLVLSNRNCHILLNEKNFPGMCSRGAASLNVMVKRDPILRAIMHRPRKNNLLFECPECGWSCNDRKPPDRCPKCGNGALEQLRQRVA